MSWLLTDKEVGGLHWNREEDPATHSYEGSCVNSTISRWIVEQSHQIWSLRNQVEVLTTSTALTYCHIVLESHCPQSCCYQVDWKWKSSISEILNFIMENKLQMYCCYKLIHVLNQSRGNTYRTVKFGIIENSGGRIPVKLLLSNRLQKIHTTLLTFCKYI